MLRKGTQIWPRQRTGACLVPVWSQSFLGPAGSSSRLQSWPKFERGATFSFLQDFTVVNYCQSLLHSFCFSLSSGRPLTNGFYFVFYTDMLQRSKAAKTYYFHVYEHFHFQNYHLQNQTLEKLNTAWSQNFLFPGYHFSLLLVGLKQHFYLLFTQQMKGNIFVLRCVHRAVMQ